MKANSRRRVLISSLAMLLVAIVALGTATYAWFTNSTQATANGISVTANAAKGLQISTNGTKWGTNETWAAVTNSTISPLSVPYTVNSAMPETGFYAKNAGIDGAWSQANVDAGIKYEFAEHSIGAPAAYANSDSFMLSYKVDVKVTGLADDNTKKYDLSAGVSFVPAQQGATEDLGKVIRIALVDSADGTVYGVYGDASVKALTSTTPNVAENASATTTADIALGQIDGTQRTFYVYIWIEGQDADCVDDVMNMSGDYKVVFKAPGLAE